jgi:dihydroorotate dehydrogenase (NAD+) catalytic subunit
MKLDQQLFGATFQNPILLASGTCGYGEELDGCIDIDELGGFVTKAVTLLPRAGNAPLRVTEFAGGMLNSVGLANVGLAAFKAEKLPWLKQRLRRAQVLVNVAGFNVGEFAELVEALDEGPGFLGFELNLSCPNVKEGVVYATRADLITDVVQRARSMTRKPLVAKLAPNVPDIGLMAEAAVAAGADAVSLINTMPGLLFDLDSRKAVLGGGTGGVSGAALLPIGVYAVRQARKRIAAPIIAAGGVRTAGDALQYVLAGASLVQIGTASFADPRTALRVISELGSLGARLGAARLEDLLGTGQLN